MISNRSTIFTDDDYYNTSSEWAIIINSDYINMFSVNIEARETRGNIGYSGQLYIGNCSNINIYDCSFVIPETASSDHGYSNIDCYTCWHNVRIENCDLTLVNDAESGGCIWIRDLQNKGCDTLIFRNNSCRKISHDEILAIFRGTIEDITISNNTFVVDEKNASPSVMNFTLGADSSTLCKNIIFEKNDITCKFTGGLIWTTNASSLIIKDNNINYTVTESVSDVSYLLRNSLSNITEISGNTFNIYSENEEVMLFYGLSSSSGILKNNTINTFCIVGHLINGFESCENNIINLNKKCKYAVFNGCDNIQNNNVYCSDEIASVFQWYNKNWDKNAYINNNINIYKNAGTLFSINQGTMNSFQLIATTNNINCNPNITVERLLFMVVHDEGPQTVNLKNNVLGLYNSANIYLNPSNQNIIIEN